MASIRSRRRHQFSLRVRGGSDSRQFLSVRRRIECVNDRDHVDAGGEDSKMKWRPSTLAADIDLRSVLEEDLIVGSLCQSVKEVRMQMTLTTLMSP